MLKDLNLLRKYIKNEEVSYNFKLVFTLSKRPHFNSVYSVRVPFLTGIAVDTLSVNNASPGLKAKSLTKYGIPAFLPLVRGAIKQ